MSRDLLWISAGAASAVAAKLKLAKPSNRERALVYCKTGAEHPDNARFLADLEQWLGHPIERIGSAEYRDTWDVWERRRYMAGTKGAPCTRELKLFPRLAYQRPDDHHVFGYTADAPDVERAKRFAENYFELSVEFPLIEHGITKHACIDMIERAGIRLPPMYALGFHNNNCIPCSKATSPSYWALIRREFPDQFARAADLSRQLGARLCRINDERRFIDEIPADHPTTNPIQPSCDFMCQLAELDMKAAE